MALGKGTPRNPSQEPAGGVFSLSSTRAGSLAHGSITDKQDGIPSIIEQLGAVTHLGGGGTQSLWPAHSPPALGGRHMGVGWFRTASHTVASHQNFLKDGCRGQLKCPVQ